ncbi:SAM-dependent methyltransferase [Fictibacillus norfolkensis]|uniref:SAM-dependent methyltransferase n=1 Tax=Fictibacillus norfolkensis TaxID=2762233 RepID=A0ABR8SM60_9BACL|nr:SAM-dependent methyltransferase [Fictibacillus norfolkensis]MBD7964527.1 SAM-dependent methyltransferase [Fictibacillus norfolkensis]
MPNPSLLQKKLADSEWLTMEEYMEHALYHPLEGYYMKENTKIGKNGDFYTASLVSDVFANVWADLFIRTIEDQNLQPIVVEFGGGTGHFSQQVLESWSSQSVEHISYVIVELSPYHRRKLDAKLAEYPITILCSLNELIERYPSFRGIIFANEVLDAFPLRIFQKKNDEWYEKGVSLQKNTEELRFLYKKVENSSLQKKLEGIFRSRDKANELEVSFSMLSWLKNLYEWIELETCLFFVDYGLLGEEWNTLRLKEGSIRGYYRHQIQNNPLAFPGMMDITFHIDWEQVIRVGIDSGVTTLPVKNQGDFLLEEGLLSWLQDTQSLDPFSIEHKRNRAIRSFLLDHSLANGFQVIHQKKQTVL